MPKYLWEVSYSPEGTKGLLKDGGSKRRTAAEKVLRAVGGRLEAFYYAFGKSDAYVIAEVPRTVLMMTRFCATLTSRTYASTARFSALPDSDAAGALGPGS